MKEALDEHAISADLYEAPDVKVAELLDEAAERADSNERKTVMPYDL